MSSEHNPLVSVLMTAYNREKYIAEAIESVLASTYTNFELIIVDDCSKDSTLEIAHKYAEKDIRIKVYANDKNYTDYPNRNKAASYASGKYLKYLDSDDLLYPYGLSILVNRMEQFPEAGLGLCKRGWVERPFPILLTPEESYRESFIHQRFLFANAPTSTIIRRNVFEELRGFTGLNQLGDHEFWLMVAARYPIVLIESDVTWNHDLIDSEKYKDSEATKNKLRLKINLAALNDEYCPLSKNEVQKAIQLLKVSKSKIMAKKIVNKLKNNLPKTGKKIR